MLFLGIVYGIAVVVALRWTECVDCRMSNNRSEITEKRYDTISRIRKDLGYFA